MTVGSGWRKLVLTVHITCSVGWVGAILAYLTLNVAALSSANSSVVRGAYLMLDPVLRLTVTPLAVGCLITGVGLSLITRWGLFRHYWVVISLVLTVLAVAVLILHVPDVARISSRAADLTMDPRQLGGDLPHTLGGLVVVLVPLVLNIYKPRGLTRFGRRASRSSVKGRSR